MVRFFATEEFKEVTPTIQLPFKLAVSNYGRLVTYTNDIREGTIRPGSSNNGYRVFRYNLKVPGSKTIHYNLNIYRAVAKLFLPPPTEDQKHVIHLDHDIANDNVRNLKYVNMKDKVAHNNKSPKVIEGRQRTREIRKSQGGRKLTSTQVMRLKKRLQDPNRKTRMKILAKQFNISEMQLYRIKRGENWGDIKV